MNLVSSICITAGRVSCLNEAIACFMAQSHAPKELVILNTLPAQVLVGDFPGVKIINLPERPKSLAAARNIAIRNSSGDILCTYDDDDGYGNDFLAAFAKHFTDGIDWVYQPRQFYVERDRIKSITAGSQNVFAFTRKAFDALGGYEETLTVGEDRQFIGRLTSQFAGVRIPEEGFIPQFFYRWGQGAIDHISGRGDDRAGRTPAWERAGKILDQKIKARAIPTGRIGLKPHAKHDYGAMARQFIQSKNPKGAKGGVACVLLGRLGDIINGLPFLRHIAESYAKPHLVISREFLPLLDGVSYVEPYPVDLPYDQMLSAIKLAEKEFAHVIVAQVWGTGWPQPRLTEAYNKESWRQAGFLNKFDDAAWFPVFDRRNLAREEALFTKLNVPGKPMLLVKLDGGISSPCLQCPTLMPLILERFGEDFNVVDLSSVKSERIFDLLGLFSRAACLLSVDTSLLHLAAASSVPLVALVNPSAWLGTSPRGNCTARMTYTEALADPAKVIAALETAISQEQKEMAVVELRQPPSTRKIYHCCERHDQSPDNRKSRAWASWDALYANGVIPCHLWEYPRDATGIGDKRRLPYLKDVLQPALDQAADDDIVFFTNDDNWLHPDLTEMLRYHVSVFGPCCSQRREFKGRLIPTATPQKLTMLGKHHMGRDLFAFTKAWLVRKWDELPDFILGASDWDLMFAAMIRLEYGIVTTRQNITEHIHPAELPLGYVAHQHHPPSWSKANNVNSSASQIWNRRLFREWAGQHLPTLKFSALNCI